MIASSSPTRTGRSRRLAAAGLVALLGAVPTLAACGDDGGTVEADSPTSSSTPTTVADPDASTTIPDMGAVAGPVGSCLGAAAKFTNLVQGVLEGSEGAKRSQAAAEQLKAELPADLQDDADVVAAKFGEIADRGGALTDADINDPAYAAATQALADYFGKDCQ